MYSLCVNGTHCHGNALSHLDGAQGWLDSSKGDLDGVANFLKHGDVLATLRVRSKRLVVARDPWCASISLFVVCVKRQCMQSGRRRAERLPTR